MIDKKWFTVLILGSIFMIGELGHFLLGTVARPMAQDLGFGDQSCLKRKSFDPTQISSEICTKKTTEAECINTTVSIGIKEVHPCEWHYSGLGLSYQLLAGPAYMAVYTVAAIGWGYLADKKNRVKYLSLGTVCFSVAILATSVSLTYWQAFLLRMALAVWESACIPMSTGIIADLFSARKRGLAMGLLHWGLYLGYGLSFAIGHYVTEANILGQGWRASYFISGLPGFIFAALLFFTTAEPERRRAEDEDEQPGPKLLSASTDSVTKIQPNHGGEYGTQQSDNSEGMMTAFKNPAILLLILGACVRHMGGFCWAYNSALYFKTYYPDYDAFSWLTGISIGGGVLSVTIGGWLSDTLVKKYGIPARALVLAGSQMLAAPFALMVFQVAPPTALYFVLGSYIAAEMWFGVMFAILVELVPITVRSKAVAIAIFFINNFGGNGPVIIDPLSKWLGYRTAMTILYSGTLIISSLIFFLCFLILLRQSRTTRNRRMSMK